jgi:hypothetical protein
MLEDLAWNAFLLRLQEDVQGKTITVWLIIGLDAMTVKCLTPATDQFFATKHKYELLIQSKLSENQVARITRITRVKHTNEDQISESNSKSSAGKVSKFCIVSHVITRLT